jgi:DNA-binding MarR family transcriptional regulator
MARPYYALETLAPANSVGFLLKRCGVLMQQVAEARFASLPISFTQWMTLATLTQQACVSASQLSAELGHDMGALTRVVDELERRGFVRRERSRRDRRSVEIAITASGRRQAQNGKRLVVELLNQLVEPFGARETDTLIVMLQRLLLHLQDIAQVRPIVSVPAPAGRAAAARHKSRPRGGA